MRQTEIRAKLSRANLASRWSGTRPTGSRQTGTRQKGRAKVDWQLSKQLRTSSARRDLGVVIYANQSDTQLNYLRVAIELFQLVFFTKPLSNN